MNKQNGITLVGMLLSMVMVIMGVVIAMHVIPIYLENYEIERSVQALATLDPTSFTDDDSANVLVLQKKLIAQLDINGITAITSNQFQILPSHDKPGYYTVAVKYKKITPLMGNVSLLFNFNNAIEVKVGLN